MSRAPLHVLWPSLILIFAFACSSASKEEGGSSTAQLDAAAVGAGSAGSGGSAGAGGSGGSPRGGADVAQGDVATTPPDGALPLDSAALPPEAAPPVDGAGPPPVCTPGPVYPIASSLPASSGGAGPDPCNPSLAYFADSTPPIFAAAWSNADRVLFNAVDRDGRLQHAVDVVAVPPEPGRLTRSARLISTGDGLTLAVGHGTEVSVRRLVPATGLATSAASVSSPPRGNLPADVIGLALGPSLVVASRAQESGEAPVKLDSFSTGLTPVETALPLAISNARHAGLAWWGAADRFAVAQIVLGLDGGIGEVVMLDANLASSKRFAFTPSGSKALLPGAGVAVTAAGGRLAVTWIDTRPCDACKSPQEVFLTTVEPSGALMRWAHVSDTNSTVPKMIPQVAFDGTSYSVIWEELESVTNSRVMFRRFDAELRPLGVPVDVSAGAPWRPVGGIDLVVEGRNSYGVVMSFFDRPHHFTRITCTGP